MGDRDGVSADRQVDEIVGAIFIRLLRARELGLVPDDGHRGFGQHAAALVGYGSRDAAQGLLRQSAPGKLE